MGKASPIVPDAIASEPQAPKLSHVRVQGFRRLRELKLPLRPLNVLIGANGSGKTSLLDVFGLLGSSASGTLRSSLSDLGGVDAVLTNATDEQPRAELLGFGVESPVEGHAPLSYFLAVKPGGVSYEHWYEVLSQPHQLRKSEPFKYIDAGRGKVRYFSPIDKKLVAPTWDYNPLESALSQVPKMYQAPERFRAQLASSTYYHALDVGPRAKVRLPQPLIEAQLPGRDGENLVSCLYWMREAEPDRFEVIEDTLRVGFPSFDRLNFPPVAAGTLAMTWKDRHVTQPFFTHQLSEGTLRFLWLVTLLYSPGLTEITLLDEPEVSLHPELLSVLADCLREASRRTQLVVATHADRLVRFLRPEEVVTFDLQEDGSTTAARADELDLDAWLSDYTLDEIWAHGRMGARS